MGLFDFLGDAIAEVVVAPIKIVVAVVEVPKKVYDKVEEIIEEKMP